MIGEGRLAALVVGGAVALLAAPATAAAAGPSARVSLSTPIVARGHALTVSLRRSRLARHDRLVGAVVRFGDGSRATVVHSLRRRLKHSYRHSGRYVVSVALTDVRGHTSRARHTVLVLRPRAITPRHGTAVVQASQVLSSVVPPGLTDTVIVLKRGAEVPTVGAGLVVLPGGTLPNGFLGQVSGASRNHNGTATVTSSPAALDAAYSRFSVAIARRLTTLPAELLPGATTSSLPARARAASVSSLAFSCQTAAGYTVGATADLSDTHVDASLDIRSRAIHFLFTSQPKFTLAAHFAGSASCTLANAAALQILIPVAAPLTFTLRPQFEIHASGTIDAQTTWAPRVAIGFDRAPGISQNPVGFGSSIAFSATGNASASLYAGLSLELGIGGRLGITGSAGPELDGSASLTTNGATTTACAHAEGFLKVQLSADADVFIHHWSFSLFNGQFFHRVLYDHCATTASGGTPPSGGGNPPSGGGNPPSGGGNPPTGGGNPPTGGGNPPTGGGTPPRAETVGGVTHTWTNYTNAGGTQGPSIPAYTTVQIACKLPGFRVADGNTWWYRIASSPWNSAYYASADAFYNNGQTSGSLHGTPFVDPAVPDC